MSSSVSSKPVPAVIFCMLNHYAMPINPPEGLSLNDSLKSPFRSTSSPYRIYRRETTLTKDREGIRAIIPIFARPSAYSCENLFDRAKILFIAQRLRWSQDQLHYRVSVCPIWFDEFLRRNDRRSLKTSMTLTWICALAMPDAVVWCSIIPLIRFVFWILVRVTWFPPLSARVIEYLSRRHQALP
jgi:hypothetical protein